MSKVKYNFIQNDTDGQIVFQSTVESFGLDHITEKDFESFYTNFSKTAHFDTGLLPVDGSGMLSIRTAGDHTQIGYQYAPGMYFINWGAYEGDPKAEKLYVAQPYRIVIADLYNGNLLGARTFYSPIPIQHPSAPLYHVNLPNINCRGYRKNAVGWICLYHNEDISMYPFNEKVAKVLERCSGVEAYNDANMSETDGPRFYRDKGKPVHMWNPQEWEKYSAEHGHEWMLDPNLLVPVLVQDMDHQDRHYDDGQPLTYADAVLGSYRAYYHDENPDKLYNTLIRDDRTVNQNELFNLFKKAYSSSTLYGQPVKKADPFSESIKVRQDLSNIFVSNQQNEFDDEEDSEEGMPCDQCGEFYDEESFITLLDGNQVCEHCVESHCIWIEHASGYVFSSPDVKWLDSLDNVYYKPMWNQIVKCPNCDDWHPYDTKAGYTPNCTPVYMDPATGEFECTSCSESCGPCPDCGEKFVTTLGYEILNAKDLSQKVRVCNECLTETPNSFKDTQQNLDELGVCICGSVYPKNSFTHHKHHNADVGYQFTISAKDVGEDLMTAIVDRKWIISNYIYVDHILVKDGVSKFVQQFKFTIDADISCPNCHLNNYVQEYDQDNAKFQEVVRSSLPAMLENIQPEQQFFGLNIMAVRAAFF